MKIYSWAGYVSALSVLAFTASAAASLDDGTRKLSRDIFQQLIEINTTDSVGSNTIAANAMRQRLLDAGFDPGDVVVLGPNDRKGNMIVRYHAKSGSSLKPVLIICHLDVVEAKRTDWTTDPFQFVEKDGYFYGRGTLDVKSGDAVLMTTLIRFKKEGFEPDRDIIVALTSDEEGGTSNGVDWLLKNHRDLIDAEYVINPDAGGVFLDKGKPMSFNVEATEKLYADFELTARNPGGHSSLPVPDNAIYRVADALGRLQQYAFPEELNNVTRALFATMLKAGKVSDPADVKALLATGDKAAIERLSADPVNNSMLRTTCVATRLSGGHANNALPQTAQAIVNCRILPGHSPEEVRQGLIKVFADPKVEVAWIDSQTDQRHPAAPDKKSFAPPPMRPDVKKSLETVVDGLWPSVPIVPIMEAGASDSIYTMAAGIPSYGVSGMAIERDDVRAHGKDERIPVGSYYQDVVFYYEFLKTLTSLPR